jgi:hypothetical protein
MTCMCVCVLFLKLITVFRNTQAYETASSVRVVSGKKSWLRLYQAVSLLLIGAIIRRYPIPVKRLLKSLCPSVCPHETTAELLN